MSFCTIEQAVRALQSGKAVGLPTETVYGLAADAFNEKAVGDIFKIKGRPLLDPLIVHVYDLEGVHSLAETPPFFEKIADNFWPGPLTLIMRKKSQVLDLVTAGLDTVAVRMPGHVVMREVLRQSGLCLAAPSANPFGYVSPTTAQHVIDSLGDKVEYVVDGGDCELGLESTILDISDSEDIKILRPGPVTLEALETVLGLPVRLSLDENEKSPKAPGLLKSHYSPNTKVRLIENGGKVELNEGEAVVYIKRPEGLDPGVYYLSENGDASEAARGLFSLLRRLDGMGYQCIYIEQCEPRGVGVAVNDRIKRAANS